MPTQTFISKRERTASGFKAAKYQVSRLLCANTKGNYDEAHDAVPFPDPRTLKGKNKDMLSVFWRANRKVW